MLKSYKNRKRSIIRRLAMMAKAIVEILTITQERMLIFSMHQWNKIFTKGQDEKFH